MSDDNSPKKQPGFNFSHDSYVTFLHLFPFQNIYTPSHPPHSQMVATQEQEPESGLQEDLDAAVVAFQGKYEQPSHTHARNKPLVQDRVYRVCHDPSTVVARRKENWNAVGWDSCFSKPVTHL